MVNAFLHDAICPWQTHASELSTDPASDKTEYFGALSVSLASTESRPTSKSSATEGRNESDSISILVELAARHVTSAGFGPKHVTSSPGTVSKQNAAHFRNC